MSIGIDLRPSHVPAHYGIPGNEAADLLAKSIRQFQIEPTQWPPAFGHLLRHEVLPHAWFAVNKATDLPSIAELIEPQTVPDQERLHPLAFLKNHTETFCTSTNSIIFASINVQTLSSDDEGWSTKRTYFEQQINQHQWGIVCLQETRTKTTRLKNSSNYHMLQVAAQRGHGGLEIWISKQFDIIANKSDFFKVFHQSHRILGVAIRLPNLSFDVIGLHAPPQRGSEEANSFWEELRRCTASRKCELVIMGDFNSHVDAQHPCTGEVAPEKACENGRQLKDLLLDFDMLLPSTFDTWHCSDSFTCISSRGGRHRIDYIATPLRWQPHLVCSQVHYDFDMLNPKDDHFPVSLKCTFCIGKSVSSSTTKSFDREALSNESAMPIVQQIFQQMPTPPWSSSVDKHLMFIDEYLYGALCHFFPKKRRCVRQPYFEQQDLLLIDDRKECLETYRRCHQAEDHAFLRLCFDAWTRKTSHFDAHLQELSTMKQHTALQLLQLNVCQQRFRLHRKKARDHYFQQVVQDFSQAWQQHNSRELYAALKPLRPQSAKHRIKMPTPLPGLHDCEQHPLHTREEVCHQWEKHWSKIELAEPVDLEEVTTSPTRPKPLDLAECPSLTDLELALRNMKKKKAPGLDLLPPELFRIGGVTAARKLFPLLLKELATRSIPIRHQGGLAIPIFKHKGSFLDCNNYRSILLAPVLAKALSQTWRPRLALPFAEAAHHLQLGARHGLGAVQNLHALRVRHRIARATKRTSTTIFLDVQSAFYSTMRALLFDWEPTTDFVCHVFRTYNLPPTAFDDFCEIMAKPGALSSHGVSDLYVEMTEATFEHAWFCVPHGQKALKTKAGTRPGDPLADILFSFAMKLCLDQIYDQLAPLCQQFDIFLPLTYVDDLAVQITTHAEHAVPVAAAVAQVLYDATTAHGMRPNLSAGKTEAVISFAGPGHHELRRQLEEKDSPGISFCTTHAGKQKLRVVHHYTYLGGTIDENGSPMPDIKRHLAQAYGQLRPMAKNVVSNQDLPLQARTTVLKSLGLSRATYAIGTWGELNITQNDTWEAGIMRLYKLLLPSSDFHVSKNEVLEKTNLQTPQQILRQARTTLILQLGLHGCEPYRDLLLREATIPAPSHSFPRSNKTGIGSMDSFMHLRKNHYHPARLWTSWTTLLQPMGDIDSKACRSKPSKFIIVNYEHFELQKTSTSKSRTCLRLVFQKMILCHFDACIARRLSISRPIQHYQCTK